MDCKDGCEHLAPPRPPKLISRIHRPRAAEPMVSETVQQESQANINSVEVLIPSAAPATNSTTTLATIAIGNVYSEGSGCSPTQIQENNNIVISPGQNDAVDDKFTSALLTYNHITSGDNSINFGTNELERIESEHNDYQVHHLTYLPQRFSIGRNTPHFNFSSPSSISIPTTNTFITSPTSTLLHTDTGASHSRHFDESNTSNNNNTENSISASPVSLSQPRPICERFSNEYVDGPLRISQQLHRATRAQHPAGQQDNSQTTPHHLLLLPQRENRELQQTRQYSNRSQGIGGSSTFFSTRTARIFKTECFSHALNNQKSSKIVVEAKSPGKVPERLTISDSSKPYVKNNNLPITKQPATSESMNGCIFKKRLSALDNILDMQNIPTNVQTSQNMISAIHSSSSIAASVIITNDPSSFNAITCPRCGRCRCEQCQSPRPLPQTWICNKTCLCSAESLIDYLSCLCCAKALFYHCARDNDMDYDDESSTPCVDNPCSCGPYKRTQRWGWLSALSLVLPCLWCYWPMRGCISFCEKYYGKYAGHGCRCKKNGSTSCMLPIVRTGIERNIGDINDTNAQNSDIVIQSSQPAIKTSCNGYHHFPIECNISTRIVRKGDLTHEKRLLDTNLEY